MRLQKANEYAIESAAGSQASQKIDKYLYSSYKYGDFSDRASDFCEIDN